MFLGNVFWSAPLVVFPALLARAQSWLVMRGKRIPGCHFMIFWSLNDQIDSCIWLILLWNILLNLKNWNVFTNSNYICIDTHILASLFVHVLQRDLEYPHRFLCIPNPALISIAIHQKDGNQSIYLKIHLNQPWAYAKNISFYHKYTCSTMFITALFLTSWNGKQPRYPSVDIWF